MHVLWWGIKVPLILKYLKNGIERLQVVSGKIELPVEGKKSGKTWSTQNKITLVVRGEGEQTAFCSGWNLTDWLSGCFFNYFWSLKQLSKMVPWLPWRGKRCCLLRVGIMLKCMWIVEVRQFIPIQCSRTLYSYSMSKEAMDPPSQPSPISVCALVWGSLGQGWMTGVAVGALPWQFHSSCSVRAKNGWQKVLWLLIHFKQVQLT